jgi:dolichyl-phosphate-mannose--protein O-mannosyl transferase
MNSGHNHVLGLPLSHWLILFIVFLVSFLARVPFINHPSCVVFDETHFGSFVSDYLRGVSFFDIHPPLAKLILVGVSRSVGYDGSFNFSDYGAPYDSDFYIWLRLTPALFCSMAAPLMTAALLLKGAQRLFALSAGLLFALDLLSIVQSRFILTDGILYFFVAATIFLTALVELHDSAALIALQALAAACAFSVKFTAAGLFVYIACSHIRLLYGRPYWFASLALRGIAISIVFAVVFTGLLLLHLTLLPLPGYGDRYFDREFRQAPAYARVTRLVKAMYIYNRDLKATHPAQSRWYQWPFFAGAPVVFWTADCARIILLPNPFTVIASTVGFAIAWRGDWCYGVGYAISFFPFAFVNRATFVYHHEIPVMFGLMAFAAGARRAFPAWTHEFVRVLVIAGAAAVYVVFSPFVYGIRIGLLARFRGEAVETSV